MIHLVTAPVPTTHQVNREDSEYQLDNKVSMYPLTVDLGSKALAQGQKR